MVETSAGSQPGNHREHAPNSNGTDDFCEAVEHDCSVNGSEIGSWGGMDSDEGREEDNEGERRGDKEINPGSPAKRKKR